MSDTQQGPGWWLASDGKWYPPRSTSPPPPTKSRAGAAQTLGIISLLLNVLYVPGILAIVWGNRERRLDRRAQQGFTTGIIGTAISVLITIGFVVAAIASPPGKKVVAPAVATSSPPRPDADRAESDIRNSVHYSDLHASVRCPRGVNWHKGGTFTCTVVDVRGVTHSVVVHMDDDAGNFSWDHNLVLPTTVMPTLPRTTTTTTAPPPPPPSTQPPGPKVSFGDGTYRVGTDIAPGTYRSIGSEDTCIWQRLSGFSGDYTDVIASEIGANPQVATILAGDVGFSSHFCGGWEPA